ncbi:hypothetical protein P691DRAFT_300234 [Macrolepiota fuliginosa MF-IS2]|uniref:Uncharacterized protein n=1 Tax=Macrolepiota fuliginosa MF-IS2 TaxID=1400762 RepID=A0A9P6C4Y4_9AGAR|nr:hypothetical protein P691DRAFT_300234 [Macrolepiota fuliginosa MF-IS2]
MPTTRRQAKEGMTTEATEARSKPRQKKEHKKAPKPSKEMRQLGTKPSKKERQNISVGDKRTVKHEEAVSDENEDLPQKRRKLEDDDQTPRGIYQAGVIERGHIYFFYRPKVQLEEAHSVEEVRNLHMLLVPSPPGFAVAATSAEQSTGIKGKYDPERVEEAGLKILEPGADAIPAPASTHESKKYRLITIGKKHLPDPEKHAIQSARKEIFWGTVTALGDNLEELQKGLGPKTYETKTRGTRHEVSSRLAARGAYAIVNTEATTPSRRTTHLGYHLSHPPPSEMGDVQRELGIATASSFVVQVKNPLAPATGPRRVSGKGASYPDWLMHAVFGTPTDGETKQTRGREDYGLRFASCETPELLDYLHAQLLLIAARSGEEGLEESLGEGRGEALHRVEEGESKESINRVFEELGVHTEMYPAEPLEGGWI